MSDDNFLPGPSRTILEWCAHRKISRAKFYQLDKLGLTPKTHYVGTKRIIGPVADAEWIRAREVEAAQEATAA
jgi:hypothetical protein